VATRRKPQGSLVERARAHDQARDSFPGEHWLALGAGLAAWALTRKSPSVVVRTAGMLAATALVGRAASGRDGVGRLLRYTPLGRRIR
jgi:hypothetical protein